MNIFDSNLGHECVQNAAESLEEIAFELKRANKLKLAEIRLAVLRIINEEDYDSLVAKEAIEILKELNN